MTTRRRHFRYVRPWLYPKQEAAVFAPARIVIIEATTKCGKTVACLVWLVECAVRGRPGDQFWWVAPVATQARMAFDRLRRFLPPGTCTAHGSRLTITLPNHTTLCFKSADHPDALYGEDVRAVVIDEATRCKEAAWHAVRSTVTATHGHVRIIGNVKGRRNWVYRLARQAEAGAPDLAYARLTADDAVQAGIFHAAELASAQRVLPPQVFRELFYAQASDDQGNPFGLDAIRDCVEDLSTLPPVAWGWDLAKSVDWTVGIALDFAGRVCRLERFQKPWDETIATILSATGAVPALVDRTGVGDPILERLQHRSPDHFQGFTFSASSKQQLMERLAMAMHERQVRFPDGPIRAELEAFEYHYSRTGVRYAAPDGLHDDAVVALALAVRLWDRQRHVWPLAIVTGSGPAYEDDLEFQRQVAEAFERRLREEREALSR